MDRPLLFFRVVAVLAIVAAFGQVTLGGVVRVTDSGLGCPDWPLCHGRLIPDFNSATLIEYSHRLSASVLTVLVVATAALSWRSYRHRTWVVLPSLTALALVISAALLGAAAVLTDLAFWTVMLHLGIAELLTAALVLTAIAGWDDAPHASANGHDDQPRMQFEWVMPYAVVSVLLVILWGSYMVGYGAGSVCSTWPLCKGSLFPDGAASAIHMGHRLFAAIVGLLVMGASLTAWSQKTTNPAAAWTGALLLPMYGIQILIGAVTVWAGFSAGLRALHLSFATLVWVNLVAAMTLVYLPQLRASSSAAVLRHRQA